MSPAESVSVWQCSRTDETFIYATSCQWNAGQLTTRTTWHTELPFQVCSVCVLQDDVFCGNLSPLCGLHLGCPTFRAHFVLIIDWKCLQIPVNDFVYALKKKTIVSNSHCKKNKKPGGEQGKRTILIKETITRVRNSSVKGRLSPLMHKHQHSGVITLDAQTLLGEPSAKIDWFIHWKLIVPPTAQGHLRAF